MHEPDSEEFDAVTASGAVDIRNFSVKCGRCERYQTLTSFARGDGSNAYTYVCENDICDPDLSKTVVEVPVEIDVFARRDPSWGGGKRHAGGDAGRDDDPAQGEDPSGNGADEDGILQVIEYDPFTDD